MRYWIWFHLTDSAMDLFLELLERELETQLTGSGLIPMVYDDEKAYSFVNGVLNGIASELEAADGK